MIDCIFTIILLNTGGVSTNPKNFNPGCLVGSTNQVEISTRTSPTVLTTRTHSYARPPALSQAAFSRQFYVVVVCFSIRVLEKP